MKRAVYIFSFTVVLVSGCRKPYLPPVARNNNSFLVVEGNIDPGSDSTIIRLSWTRPLSAPDSVQSELHATVSVESDVNVGYPLTETGNGFYVSRGLNLDGSRKYRLKIITTAKKIYQSVFLPVKSSPAIDSVYFRVENNGVRIYTDTHDELNKTVYYRWQFTETYQIHSLYDSHYMHVKNLKDTVINRPLADKIYSCWITRSSNDIVINSSEKLSKDLITKNEINFIPSTSEKIEDRYSILVKQYALTKEAYAYWQLLKTNTEQLGSIFDSQPSELPGNIHCITVPNERVIGFISVGSYTQARIFVDTQDLPFWRTETPYYDNCPLDTLYYLKNGINEVAFFIYPEYDIPIDEFASPVSGKVFGFSAQRPRCVDCTLRGPNRPPAFWVPR